MNEPAYHIPALLPQCLEALDVRPGGIYIDVTLGGGGHSCAIAQRLDGGHLYSFDQDNDAIVRAVATDVFTPVHGNFRYLSNYADYLGIEGKVDGILADLGVSFHHFDDGGRGFSFRADAPLDMRMNRDAGVTAAQLLEKASEDELAGWLTTYGDLRNGRRMARRIVSLRARGPIATTGALVEAVRPLINPAQEKKELAQVFQALRIVVNSEMEALEELLKASVEVLKPGGRLAVITYHSLEDRLVKNFMRTGNTGGRASEDMFGHRRAPLKMLTSKPIVPDEAEIESNPRSRSAKLRVAQKI